MQWCIYIRTFYKENKLKNLTFDRLIKIANLFVMTVIAIALIAIFFNMLGNCTPSSEDKRALEILPKYEGKGLATRDSKWKANDGSEHLPQIPKLSKDKLMPLKKKKKSPSEEDSYHPIPGLSHPKPKKK